MAVLHLKSGISILRSKAAAPASRLARADLGAMLIAIVLLAPSVDAQTRRDRYAATRHAMVREYIAAEGITDPRVLEAMRTVPRHEFVRPSLRRAAYMDHALDIGHRQTISPPYIVAYMTETLDPQPDDRVLEIGTGSGYQAAILGELVKEVYSIEIVEPLGRQAAARLEKLGYDNVVTKVGDGYLGWPEHAPFDKIIVTCSPENVPKPLVEQLKEGGRMIIPLGERYQQTLYLFRKKDGELVQEALLPTLFVPMTGTAEAQREVKPDPLNPSLHNGGFEEVVESSGSPVGWHYIREFEVREESSAPEGDRYMAFVNDQAGRYSQALQAFPIEGSKIRELNLDLHVQAKNVRPGARAEQVAAVAIAFYDSNRRLVGERALAAWRGSFDWREEHLSVRVPAQAKEAILRIGLLGGTGELDVDNVRLSKPD